MAEPLRALGIFPHPDDESYSCAGTLALLADGGAEVHLLCATAGEAGKDLRPAASRHGSLAEARATELAQSCKVLGILPPRFLALADGALGTVNFPEVVGRIVGEIRRVRPHLVLGLGEDGVYGHPDHLALFRLVLAAFGSAAGSGRFPEAEYGPYWQPARLFTAAFPRGMFRPMYEHMLGSEYTSSMRGLDPDKLGVEPSQIAAAIDIRAAATRKLAAIACHASQLPGGDPYALFPGDLVRRTLTTELFSLAAGVPVQRRLRGLDEGLEP
ncbi:MAG TPA: PIG-L deacetylase family protein [Dehalococcoidia bacterium]|jgi:N-acetyl-1-D-myo-inositol-2-amino-2-deoxy-alpha-D-glucopyranoside deacetylase